MTVVFTEAQQALLSSILNRIIPAEGKMPGAGELGLVGFFERVVAPDPKLRRLVNDGLTQIAIIAARQPGQEFPGLGKEAQNGVLREVQACQPDFFDFLLRQCYNGYYTNPQIQELIGYRLPVPGEYAFDESLLEPQRQRAPFWTRV